MEETLKQQIREAIYKTGFPLEHYIDGVLKQHGWQTITNRHYIDDVKGVEREIDILAYKVYKDDNERIEYITSLIISCKKSEVNKWCFLTRDANPNDVNTDWTPLHYCTNDKVLSYMTQHHRELITERYLSNRATKHLYNFDERVFAYQILEEKITKKGKEHNAHWEIVKNDALHDSISTSIKALDMERRSLVERHTSRPYNRYYTFHILSVYDGEMVKAHFNNDDTIDISDITHINYINRHIVNKVDDFYIVHFIKKEILDYRLKLFDYLHTENCRTLPKIIDSFYKDIFSDNKRVQIFWKEFADLIGWRIKKILVEESVIGSSESVCLTYLYYQDQKILEIGVNFSNYMPYEGAAQILNDNEELRKVTKHYLRSIYRYNGDFTFSEEFSF